MRASEERFTAAGRTQQQDVALRQLDVVGSDTRVDALVVVVDSYRENLLRAILTDHVLVEDALDLFGLRDGLGPAVRLVLLHLFRDDVVTQRDALIADVDRRPSDELLHLLLRLAAKGAAEIAVRLVPPPFNHLWNLRFADLS
jgi:hypothetical protein